MSNPQERLEGLVAFLQGLGLELSKESLQPLNGDASFRRYFRISLEKPKAQVLYSAQGLDFPKKRAYLGSLIAVDAPPQTQKNTEFVAINKLLNESFVLVPSIIAKDTVRGYLLLEDLGNTLFERFALDEEEGLAFYYKAAVELTKIAAMPSSQEAAQKLEAIREQLVQAAAQAQESKETSSSSARVANLSAAAHLIPRYALSEESYAYLQQLPQFDADFIDMELVICREWLFEKRLQLQLSEEEQSVLDRAFSLIKEQCLAQHQGPMHRDFHCRNLMISPDGCDSSILAKLAVIDYQDMVRGPLGYDVASLLYDCYVKLDDSVRRRLLKFFFESYSYLGFKELEGKSAKDFIAQVQFCALQRHLKVLGLFNRLYLRDGKSGYLKDLSLVLDYILTNCHELAQHSEFAVLNELAKLLERHVGANLERLTKLDA